MKKNHLILLFITTLLYAESDDVKSKMILDSENFELDHESAYGITNNYSFFVAEHQIKTDDCLLFYYGTKVGFVAEDYTAENGFGQNAEKLGTIFKANFGMDYDIKKYQKLSFEGNNSKKELHQQLESLIKIGYLYNF